MTDKIEYEFGPVVVPSCSSINVINHTREIFLPERLIVPKEIARDFLITDFKVDKNSQFISTGCLPAMVFSSRAIPESISGFDCTGPGNTMTLSVTNQSNIERIFTAFMKGSAFTSGFRRTSRSMGWIYKLNPSYWFASSKKEFIITDRKGRRLFLGYGSTGIAALSTAIISVQPQCDFMPDRLIIPSTIIDNFQILSLSVMSRDQLGMVEYMDSPFLDQSFAETSPGRISLKQIVTCGAFLSITVKNVTSNPVNFQAAVVGSTGK